MRILSLLISYFFCSTLLFAQIGEQVTLNYEEVNNCNVEEQERTVITDHIITVSGKDIPYKAITGTLFVYNEKNEPIGSFFI